MKKIIMFVFSVQFVVIFVIALAFLAQIRYINLFYDNVRYISVCIPDESAYNIFLSEVTDKNWLIARVTIAPNNCVTIYSNDVTFRGKLKIIRGEMPQLDEFISDVKTNDSRQSGLFKRILPNYSFRIFQLSQPGNYNMYDLYAVKGVSEQGIINLADSLRDKGILIEMNEKENYSPFLVVIASLSKLQIIQLFVFFISSFILLFFSATRFVVYEINKSKDGNANPNFILKRFFTPTNWFLLAGGLYALSEGYIIYSSKWRTFFIKSSIIFTVIFLILFVLYYILLLFLSALIILQDRKSSVSGKRKKASMVSRLIFFCTKCSLALIFYFSINLLLQVHEQYSIEKSNLRSWDGTSGIYKVSMYDKGQERDIDIEIDLQKKVKQLYDHLVKRNNAFLMDANAIYIIDMLKRDYPLTGLPIDGFPTSITASPNYFTHNPIVSVDGDLIENKLIYSETVLNILVPEHLVGIKVQLLDYFTEYFEYYRHELYKRIYSNGWWSPLENEKLEINLIWVKEGQYYFTYSPLIRKKEENKVYNPVVIIDTGNFHPSDILAKASRCLYFEFNESQDKDVNDYLKEISGIDGFVLAYSVRDNMLSTERKIKNLYIVEWMLMIFVFVSYMIASFDSIGCTFHGSLHAVTNCFCEKNVFQCVGIFIRNILPLTVALVISIILYKLNIFRGISFSLNNTILTYILLFILDNMLLGLYIIIGYKKTKVML